MLMLIIFHNWTNCVVRRIFWGILLFDLIGGVNVIVSSKVISKVNFEGTILISLQLLIYLLLIWCDSCADAFWC